MVDMSKRRKIPQRSKGHNARRIARTRKEEYRDDPYGPHRMRLNQQANWTYSKMCLKRRFATEEDANAALSQAQARGKRYTDHIESRYYWCRLCGGYHLTSLAHFDEKYDKLKDYGRSNSPDKSSRQQEGEPESQESVVTVGSRSNAGLALSNRADSGIKTVHQVSNVEALKIQRAALKARQN